jgi:hypothetical protein
MPVVVQILNDGQMIEDNNNIETKFEYCGEIYSTHH